MSLRKALLTGIVSGNLIGLFGVPVIINISADSKVKNDTVVSGDEIATPAGTADGAVATAESPIILPLVVNELLVDPISPLTDAADEFIELFNPNGQSMDISGYALKTPSNSYMLPATVIPAGGYLTLFSSISHVALANAGGTVTLLDASGTQVNKIAWAQSVAGASWALYNDGYHWTGTTTIAASNVLKLVGAEAAAAVQVAPATPTPSPAPTPAPTPPPVPALTSVLTPVTSPVEEPGLGLVEGATAIIPPMITELLPDPVAPDTDAAAEFIEFFNATDEPFNLSGYTLRTGKALSDHYTFGTLILESGQYFYLTSAVSKLGLANAGSSAALFDPFGIQVGDAVIYEVAKPGQSWAFDGSVWGWSTTPTPGTVNLVTTPAVAAATATAVKAAAAAAAKKAAATPKKAAVAKAAATPKAKAVKAAKTTKTAKPLVAGTATGGGRWLLFVLAGLTIGYIIYEFRHDLRNYYYRALRNPSPGGAGGQTPPGRGDDRAGERPGRRQDHIRSGAGSRPVIQW